jgi:hypothetical protein
LDENMMLEFFQQTVTVLSLTSHQPPVITCMSRQTLIFFFNLD